VYSSTSAPSVSRGGPAFAPFLRRVLATLRVEVPASYDAIGGALGSRRLHLEVDDESLALCVEDGAIVVLPAARDREIAARVRTTRASLLRLLAGELDLVEAILDGDLFLCGRDEDLAAFHETLLAFLHGAIRALTTGVLYREYRDGPMEPKGES
jgi:hypothetical protein